MSSLQGVPAAAIPQLWEHLAPFVVQCLRKSREHRFDADDIASMLCQNDLQAWLVVEDKAVKLLVLTQIQVYPQAKEMVVFAASGEYPEDWEKITDDLISWAHLQGCTHVSAYMRRGLAKRMGWEERQTYCVRGSV